MNFTFLIELIVVGLSLVILGYVGSAAAIAIVKPKPLPEECRDWNQFYLMELSLFLTGILAHVVFEVSGLNSYYARYKSKSLKVGRR